MTVGVEFEMQLLDPETRDLKPASVAILERIPADLGKFVKAEIFQSMIEINSPVGNNPGELRAPLKKMISALAQTASACGADMAASGTHPFANYIGRKIYPAARFDALIDRNQWIARRLLIFGLHIHLSVRNHDEFFFLFSRLQWFLPCVLAMSASSPFWRGEDTGLQSVRMSLFESIPTGGHPSHARDVAEYDAMLAALLRSGAIQSHKDLWWDLRESPAFGTIEIRMPDMSPGVDDNLRLAAFIQTLSKALLSGILGFNPGVCPDWIVRENKWRAGRHGLEASIIVNSSGDTQPLRDLMKDLLQKMEPLSRTLGTQPELREMRLRLSEATCADRQREAFARQGDLKDVVDLMKTEFLEGLKA
jgi:carboxylate-amine ligase